jgi:hypothetical protein
MTKTSLAVHVKARHDKVMDYACDLCTYKTATKASLGKHVRAVHKKVWDLLQMITYFPACQKAGGCYTPEVQNKLNKLKN